MPSGLQLKVFLAGRVAVETNGAAIDERRFPGRQARLLFAYLVAEQGRPVPRDELAEALWGEAPPATWDTALTVLVSKLRGVLADHGIDGANVTSAFGCYRLELPEGSWVDVVAAANAAQAAEQALAAGDLDKAKAAASSAESLTRRSFLPGEDGAWVEEKRRELADVRGRAVGTLAEACLRSGEAAEALKWAEQSVALAPFRETGHRQLMEAHAAAGNRAEALRAYERCRRLLADELGTYPSPETDSIYRRLLEAPAAQAGAATPPDAPVGPAPLRSRRPLLAGVVLALALALAAVAVLATRKGSSALAAVAPNSIAVVDPARDIVVADIPLHTRPAAIAYGAGSFWVATRDDRTLLQIDPRTHRVTRTMGIGVEPTTIATGGRYVWVLGARANTLVQFDGDTGTQVRNVRFGGTIRVGSYKGQPLRLAPVGAPRMFNLAAGADAAWIGFGYGVVGRVDAETGAVEQIAAGSARGIAFGDGAVWSVGGYADGLSLETVSRIDARTGTVTVVPSATNVGLEPEQIYGIAAGPNGIWAIGGNDHRAWKIDPDVARFVAAIPVDRPPADVAVGVGAAWLANADGTLSRIDNRTATLVKTIALGRYPRTAYPVDLATGDGAVWVALH